jgi:lysophospholipase L1-like esterase
MNQHIQSSVRAGFRAALFASLTFAALQAVAQPPGGFGGPGGRFGGAGATPAGPPAPVPSEVALARPSADEVAALERALERFKTSADADTRRLLERYSSVIQIRPPSPTNTAVMPSLSQGFRQKHEANLAVAAEGDAELLFMGDSITDFWRNADGGFAGKPVLDEYFGQWKVANFGIAGDTTQGVLYRLQNGEGAGFSPKAVMLMIGTNNTGRNTAGEIAEGIGAVVLELENRFPQADILLLGVFPRGASASDPARATIKEINSIIARLDARPRVQYLDIGDEFLDASGNIPADVMSDALHPGPKGYEIWAQAVIEPITKLMQD